MSKKLGCFDNTHGGDPVINVVTLSSSCNSSLHMDATWVFCVAYEIFVHITHTATLNEDWSVALHVCVTRLSQALVFKGRIIILSQSGRLKSIKAIRLIIIL